MISKGLENLWWKILLLSVHIAGPVFTKFGQWASTRRDILSENTCNYLSTLQRNTKPHSWKCTAEILTQTFGTNWMDFIFLFENNKEPIGSGCVAQVYKAYINLGPLSQCDDKIMETIKKQCNVTLAQIAEQQLTGHPFVDDQPELDERNFSNECLIPVAIKVLHPYIYEQFQRDLWILQALANVIQFLFPRLQWLSFTECLQEFSLYMISQIDLQHEANILEKFNENFKDSSAVYFPRPIRPFVSRDILVETWEEGQPISDFICSSSTVADGLKEELAKLGVETLLKMCEEVADIFLHHSVNTCEDPDKFRASMRQLISSAREVTVSLGKLDVGNLLNEVFKLLITHRVKLESNFVSIILGILVLEGLGRSLNPDLDLLQAAAPYLLSAK
ncbi:putative aarF domain-containing protein kinase 2 isoform X2 [Tachypleus tridentatus]|uniref:putative aarF domain-containing protein kinase 2 isoform X2 n=1 Tax=Tachypleus tridentatus TaxID=6853 RepID=UPI003FD41C98